MTDKDLKQHCKTLDYDPGVDASDIGVGDEGV
jgi:hypothetical protein